MTRYTVTILLVVSTLVLAACTSTTAIPTPTAPVRVKTPSFIPPTAEEAYRLQDDCSRRGEGLLRNHHVGSALTKGQVSRYNATTNRCYVRIEVQPMVLEDSNQFQNTTALYDGQTGEFLASCEIKGDGNLGASVGFNCNDCSCVSQKIADCMSGKECEPE